ncbi:MAG: FHA domain-containing protein [Gammaproteobacteria bacterium]|nr:FHA domain-containing protein [Gammaproteobacteria bacterium]
MNSLAAHQHKQEMAILFADVAGSVALHEALGDIVAHEKIVAYLKTMSAIVLQHKGSVVETIGDEIMCTFPGSDQAYQAACKIQEVLRNRMAYQLGVRIGFNHGKTNIDKGHPFGNTVNIAARMVEIAKSGQIIISDRAYQHLSPTYKRRTRHYNCLLLKGKQEPSDIYEALWDFSDRTNRTLRYAHIDQRKYNRHAVTQLKINYLNSEKTFTLNHRQLEIGRGSQCEIQIFTGVASRIHAVIKSVQGKIIFADQSTNGSYIHASPKSHTSDDLDVYLHHEEWIMWGRGKISLGEPIKKHNKHLIEFQCD